MSNLSRSLAGLFLAIAAGAPASAATTCSATSPAHRVALVELYTSEGCSSCPPADTWLRELAVAGPGPDYLVALAFHVDYWDYLGWEDRFASPRYTARQRAIAARAGAGFVYTPQVVLNGRDYRQWSQRRFMEDVARVNRGDAAAELVLSLTHEPGRGSLVAAQARLRRQPAAGIRAQLSLAVYSSGHETRVAAGENRGATLRHDFVVRAWPDPVAVNAAGRAELRFRTRDAGVQHFDGIVAFVEQSDGEVVQALHLARCDR